MSNLSDFFHHIRFLTKWQLGKWRSGFKGSPERVRKGNNNLPGTNRKESWSFQLSSSCQSQQAHCSLLVSVVGSPISWWGLQLSLLIRYTGLLWGPRSPEMGLNPPWPCPSGLPTMLYNMALHPHYHDFLGQSHLDSIFNSPIICLPLGKWKC